jgi:hypothetical protein
MRSKYLCLLENENLRRWYDNVSRGSKITADVYLRRLGGFCEVNAINPDKLLTFKPEHLKNLFLDTVSSMEKKGYAGSYITSVLKSVKSWLFFNEIEVKGNIKIRGATDTPTLVDERVPSQDELKKVLLCGDEKTRAVCILLSQCGLRPEVLGNYDGTDGLQVRDLSEMNIQKDSVTFNKIPTMVRVRPTLSKKAHEYFTFLGKEGCDYLKDYLELRIRQGEGITSDTAIITPKLARKSFIRTINIGNSARKPIRKAGFNWRPYVLRSYFATQMMLAESKGLIIRDYRCFFMGHKGDIEAVYTLNKRRLPPDVVEQMRASYEKSQKYLQTIEPELDQKELNREFRRQLLTVFGFKPGDIKEEYLDMNDKEFQRLAREVILKDISHQNAQKVIDVSDIENHLCQGWEFVNLLPNNKAIIKITQP